MQRRRLLHQRLSLSRLMPSTTTLDAREAAHFGSLDQDWWRTPAGAPLRSLNRLRIPLVRDTVTPVDGVRWRSSRPLAGTRILDVGSGGGLVSEALAHLGSKVTGIEPVAESVALARSRLASRRHLDISYLCSTVEEFAANRSAPEAEAEVPFDGVVASEVLEHVTEVPLFLSSCHALLRPGGRLILTTVNQTPVAGLLVIGVAERLLHLLPHGTHEYRKFVHLGGLRQLLQRIGFRVLGIHGMRYYPLINHWSWTADTSISYAITAVKVA